MLQERNDIDDTDVQRDAEDVREQRWIEFVAIVQQAFVGERDRFSRLLRAVESAYFWSHQEGGEDTYDCTDDFERALIDFSDIEGWDGVLVAIARAMKS